MDFGGEYRGWTARRLTMVAAVSFCGGLLLVLLGAAAGPLLVVPAAAVAGWVLLSRCRPPSPAPQPTTTAAPPALPPAPRNPPPPVAALPLVTPPGPDLPVATVVHTEAELDEMLARRLPCWRYAAFVSVLVQRRAEIESRVRDARMGFANPSGEAVCTGLESGLYFTERLAELGDIVEQVEDFMLSAAFQDVFGADEGSADADGIRQAAERLMDYHERALALCERCRGVTVPPHCRDLQRDIGLLTALPLEGFGRFIADFTDRVDEAADVARYATGDVHLDPVELSVADDDDVLGRVSRRLQQITRAP